MDLSASPAEYVPRHYRPLFRGLCKPGEGPCDAVEGTGGWWKKGIAPAGTGWRELPKALVALRRKVAILQWLFEAHSRMRLNSFGEYSISVATIWSGMSTMTLV